MSNADDDKFAFPPADVQRSARRKTLLGLGVTQDRLDRLSAAVADSHAEFEADPTDITRADEIVNADRAVAGIDDSSILSAVDRAWNEFFPEDADFPLGLSLDAPADARTTEPEPGLDGLELSSLDEESLPEPIHEPTPTLEDLLPSLSYSGDNLAVADFDAARTEMMANPYNTEPTVARLVCLDGPASGQEFFASAARSAVGRGTTNAIVVPDVSMSRQHFEVVRNPDDTHSVVDLQSINGTTLNGMRIREADLIHGDRIEAGSSTFQFVLSGNIPPTPAHRRLLPATESTLESSAIPRPAPAPAPRSAPPRLLVTVAVAVVILTVVAVGIAVVVTQQRPKAAPAPTVDASALYLSGVEAVKVQDWDRAEEEFRATQLADPSFDGVDSQLKRIAAEREAKRHLDEARAKLDGGDIPSSVRQLEEIPADSSYAQQAEALSRDARRAEILGMYARAQTAFAEDDFETTRDLAREILELVPSHVGASDLLARANRTGENDPDMGTEVVPETSTKSHPRRKKQPLEEWGTFDLIPNERKDSKPKKPAKTDDVPIF